MFRGGLLFLLAWPSFAEAQACADRLQQARGHLDSSDGFPANEVAFQASASDALQCVEREVKADKVLWRLVTAHHKACDVSFARGEVSDAWLGACYLDAAESLTRFRPDLFELPLK